MAQMIPRRCHSETPSSERKIFDCLERAPSSDEWIVLHSLGLSHRGRKPYGEIDCVILVPSHGIACLEVKGGRVRCQDGEWFTKDRYGAIGKLSRSPFQQAREGMFGLRDAVQRHFGHDTSESRLIYASAVIFPDVEAPPASPEYERWEVLDHTDLRAPITHGVTRLITMAAERLNRSDACTQAKPSVLKRIKGFLRPDFDVGIARATSIIRTEEHIVALTHEQYEVLDLFERNERCLVEGAAGTGKTMLALEFSRRIAGSGARLQLVCYNRLLGQWLTEQVRGMPSIQAGTFHGLIRQAIIASPLSDEFLKEEQAASGKADKSTLFNDTYPFYGQLALDEPNARVDVLIVDEGQDLLGRPPVMDTLNQWLVGGLAGGRWVILGDYTRQSIFTSPHHLADQSAELKDYAPSFTHAGLRRNCRNTRRIGEETALLSGFEALPYRLGSDDGLPVDYRFFKDDTHAVKRLEGILLELAREGVAPGQVVVLSPRRFENSVASKVRTTPVHPIEEGIAGPHTVGFSTVQAFKGLESPVVIVCDIGGIQGERERALLYVAMSRARSHLILLLAEDLHRAISDVVKQRLQFAEA